MRMRRRLIPAAIAALFVGTLLIHGSAAGGVGGAIFTTVSDGTAVNQNIYGSLDDAYLGGGPQNTSASGLPDGTYYFQVTDPSGKTLLWTDDAVCRQLVVVDGREAGSTGPACKHANGTLNPANGTLPVALAPFSKSPNAGDEYKVWLIPVSRATISPTDPKVLVFANSNAKTDNFKAQGQVVAQGSCQPSSSLSVLVQGTNLTSYVPKARWDSSSTGVAAVNVEGTSIANTLIPTTSAVNSCASNPTTEQRRRGSVPVPEPRDEHVRAGVQFDGADRFQRQHLGGSADRPDPEPADLGQREQQLRDRRRREQHHPGVLRKPIPNSSFGEADSSGEDCSTGIVLAPYEFTSPSQVYIADINNPGALPNAVFTSGAPGTWTAPSQIQTLTGSSLAAGASGIAVAQGTHTGIVTGEFGGDQITAIGLPAASGGGAVPAIGSWTSCAIGNGLSNGFDPHTVTACQSPNGGAAIALLTNGGATMLARVDLTAMLALPATVTPHVCDGGTLPASVVSFIPVP
jgi:hypothetical protein